MVNIGFLTKPTKLLNITFNNDVYNVYNPFEVDKVDFGIFKKWFVRIFVRIKSHKKKK